VARASGANCVVGANSSEFSEISREVAVARGARALRRESHRGERLFHVSKVQCCPAAALAKAESSQKEVETAAMSQRFYEDDPLCLLVGLGVAAANAAVGCFMIYVSVDYENDCNMADLLLFLLVGGVAAAVSSLAKIGQVLTWTCKRENSRLVYERCVVHRVLLLAGAEFAILVWGSLLVLPRFKDWTYENAKDDRYCALTPFALAAASVIYGWCILPLQFCLCLCVICFKLMDLSSQVRGDLAGGL